jgi:hypothetical protein
MKTIIPKMVIGKRLPVFMLAAGITSAALAGNITEQLWQEYTAAGAQTFSASAGKTAWNTEHRDPRTGKLRSCASCHSSNLHHTGKHARTNKPIDPLAPSSNPERLTDRKHVEKWFKRNCKWTLGRACTPQEKGDYLAYIQSQ